MGKTILIVLIVIIVGAAAGYGGYRMGDSAGFERANQVRQQFFQQRQLGQGNPGAGSAGNPAGMGAQGRGAGISGVIKSVEGDILTLTLGQRDVQVKLSDKTQVLKTAPGTRAELTAGARVMITPEGTGGVSSAEGFTAAAITILAQ